jgi:uncharacterized protein (TIGR00255 family)
MVLSMTGFSSKMVTVRLKAGGSVTLQVELKTLNSRFFETTCKLPGSLSYLEVPIISRLKEKLVRGRVYLSVRVIGEGALQESVIPSLKVVSGYLDAAKQFKKEFSIKGDVEVSDIMNLPYVFSFERSSMDKKDESTVMKVMDEVCEQLIKARRAEGNNLLVDLEKRFDLCASHIEQIKKLFKPLMEVQKKRVTSVLALIQEGDKEAESQIGDLYSTLNKIDIQEEITRFKSHLKEVKKLLVAKQIEKGRRLDFLLQELTREINTITAKCSGVDISPVAVDVKVELEKIREQAQNIV